MTSTLTQSVPSFNSKVSLKKLTPTDRNGWTTSSKVMNHQCQCLQSKTFVSKSFLILKINYFKKESCLAFLEILLISR